MKCLILHIGFFAFRSDICEEILCQFVGSLEIAKINDIL